MGGERAHVDADLGDQHLCGALLDAGDRHQQVTLAGEGGDLLLDRPRQPVDRLVEEVDVREDLPDDQRVLGLEATDERLAQRGDLLAQHRGPLSGNQRNGLDLGAAKRGCTDMQKPNRRQR